MRPGVVAGARKTTRDFHGGVAELANDQQTMMSGIVCGVRIGGRREGEEPNPLYRGRADLGDVCGGRGGRVRTGEKEEIGGGADDLKKKPNDWRWKRQHRERFVPPQMSFIAWSHSFEQQSGRKQAH
jgi:hypothetical protein